MPPPLDASLSVLAAAEQAPDRPAVILADQDGRSVSYRELAELVRADGDTIGSTLGPLPVLATPDLPTVARILACAERHIPFALLHPRWTEAEIATVRRWLAAHDERTDPLEGCLAIVFTSGTSGIPRGVVLSRDATTAAAGASAGNLGWHDDDRWLLCLPLAHVGGLGILFRCLIARATAVLASRFMAAEVPRWVDLHRVTLASLVPAMLTKLLDEHPGWVPPQHLRAVLLGGDGASPALLARAVEHQVPVLATYGMTETCAQATTQRLGTVPGSEQGCGPPLKGVEVRIVDGRIQVRGPVLMTSYYPRAVHDSPLNADGWLDTGDLGRMDAEGRLHVLGRWDDRIVTGGETVHPFEVESVLRTHPAIREACVFGVPSEEWGQMVAAAIVPMVEPPSDQEILAFVTRRLASFRRPRLIAFASDLPRTSAGKLDRRAPGLAALGLRPLTASPVGG